MLERETLIPEPPFVDSGDGHSASLCENDMLVDPKQVNPSPSALYSEVLINTPSVQAPPKQDVWDIEEEDVQIDRSGIIPKVSLSSRVKGKLTESMKQTVVLRLIGRTIGYRSLLFNIMRLWKARGSFNLVELGNNFFMVRFANDEDYINALTQGPWVIFGCYLTVQPWDPSFSIESSTITSIVAWIRLPNLPIHLYHRGVLEKIASAVGHVFKTDHNTSSIERGKYARFAVGLDLTKPLLSHIDLEGRKQRVEYEGLPSICFLCGSYGHLQSDCPSNPTVKAAQELAPVQAATEKTPERVSLVGDMILDSGLTISGQPEYGPWMHVTRKHRKTTSPRQTAGGQGQFTQKGKVGSRHGTRFDLLGSQSEEHGESTQCVKVGISAKEHGVVEKKQYNNNNGRQKNNKGPTKAKVNLQAGENVHNKKLSLMADNLNATNRKPLGPLSINTLSLNSPKHSISLIQDDQIQFGPPPSLNSSPVSSPKALKSPISVGTSGLNKENSLSRPHGPDKKALKGLNLSKNLHKTLKVRKTMNSFGKPQSAKLKGAMLESLHSVDIQLDVGKKFSGDASNMVHGQTYLEIDCW